MVFGNLSIWLALISVLFAAWKFFRAFKIEHNLGKRERGEEYLKSARQGFYAMVVFIGIASIYLLYLIFTHQFQVSYVYRYSSRSLPAGLLLSTFWAGQEGSFLLWSLFIAILGIVFLQKIRRYEPFAMLIVSAVQAFFLLLLIKASPFALQPQIPPDGAGLNPLLQNFWMVIHPPLLFLGYAAATFPLALGLAALVKRDYDDWLHQALPWTLFTSVTLGAGIIIGA
ncbi:MAG TPA: cytochrome C assembly protein, partial [Bacteroidetes bacterium]|nr:cytochrome C assembly protein [Bacteroidota bacterium]